MDPEEFDIVAELTAQAPIVLAIVGGSIAAGLVVYFAVLGITVGIRKFASLVRRA